MHLSTSWGPLIFPESGDPSRIFRSSEWCNIPGSHLTCDPVPCSSSAEQPPRKKTKTAHHAQETSPQPTSSTLQAAVGQAPGMTSGGGDPANSVENISPTAPANTAHGSLPPNHTSDVSRDIDDDINLESEEEEESGEARDWNYEHYSPHLSDTNTPPQRPTPIPTPPPVAPDVGLQLVQGQRQLIDITRTTRNLMKRQNTLRAIEIKGRAKQHQDLMLQMRLLRKSVSFLNGSMMSIGRQLRSQKPSVSSIGTSPPSPSTNMDPPVDTSTST